MAGVTLLQVVQIADLALYGHLIDNQSPRVQAQGRSETMVGSPTVLLPHTPFVSKVRSWKLRAVIYANYGRSKNHLINLLQGLVGQVTDIVACEIQSSSSDFSLAGWNFIAGAGVQPLWLHTRGRIDDMKITSKKDSNFEAKIELDILTYFQALNPALWFCRRRASASPLSFQKTTFEASDVSPLPSTQKFFQMNQPYAFQKRFYTDDTFYYDPNYWMALYNRQEQNPDLPRGRYAADWETSTQISHIIHIDKALWNVPPLSVYLLKDLAGINQVQMTVEHEADVWELKTDSTTIDVSAITTAMSDAGYTLLNTDILILGDVSGRAFIRRDDVTILNVADHITRSGGGHPGMLYPGYNRVRIINAGTIAQQHIFRRF